MFPEETLPFQKQLSEPRLEPWVRWGLGAEFPSWLWEDTWSLPPEVIFLPTPARHQENTFVVCVKLRRPAAKQ